MPRPFSSCGRCLPPTFHFRPLHTLHPLVLSIPLPLHECYPEKIGNHFLRTTLGLIGLLVTTASRQAIAQTSGPPRACCSINVITLTPDGLPLPDVEITAAGPGDPLSARTAKDGRLHLSLSSPGSFLLSAVKNLYLPLSKEVTVEKDHPFEVEFRLSPLNPARESITVEDRANPSSATPVSATGTQMKQLSGKPSTVRDALPVIPGVARTIEGRLTISDQPEHRSTLLVNALDATDPVTGRFGATVPIDSVSTLNVYKNPFLAEYGRFSSGVVAVETKRGGDEWNWELNDPTPDPRVRSGHLRGMRAFTPRLSFSGPLIRNKLFFAESGEYAMHKTPSFTLPFPFNEEKREGWNSLTQLDYIASPKHLLTLTLHAVPQHANFVSPNFYNPQPVTPSFRGREAMVSLTDHLTLGSNLLETSFSIGQTRALVAPQAPGEMIYTPTVNLGNYFGRQYRAGKRWQLVETFIPRQRQFHGNHQIKGGAMVSGSNLDGHYNANPIRILDGQSRLLERIDFRNFTPFHISDVANGFYVQDHWQLLPRISIDLGARTDYQSLTGVTRIAPRAALAVSPFNNSATTIRAGFGWFYDRVPLSIYAFPQNPQQTHTTYLPDGSINGEPRLFLNLLEPALTARRALIFGRNQIGDFAPQSATYSFQIDHQVNSYWRLRASYLRNRSDSLIVVGTANAPRADAYLLSGSGDSNSQQFEVLSKVSWKKDQQLLFSYVHSRTSGNLNDFNQFLGDYPSPIVRPDVFATAPGNIPHRFLAWGTVPIDRKDLHLSSLDLSGLRIAPLAEWRSGFAYPVYDAAQQYSGQPYSRRYPTFFSLDFRVSKDLHVTPKHALQLSFNLFNSTDHFNPDTVRWNIADRQFGQFLGQHPRRFRVDLDFLF